MTTNAEILNADAHNFISQALATSHYQIIQLAGDASSRRYCRIVNQEDSYVLMIWEPFNDNGRYPFLNVLEHFAKHGVQVPKVIAKSPKLGLVILEDLGDLTLERKFWENQNQSSAMPFYKMAIDEIIKIHYPATLDRGAGCVAFDVDFNVEKLLWEMNYGQEHLLLKFCRLDISDNTKRALQDIFNDICLKLHEQPKIICHRDYHSRNIMLTRGKARIIDFQDARTGPIQYDLVSLLHDSYVDLNESSRNELIEDYIAKANVYRNDKINRAHFDEIFKIQMIQRCFKACGSFSSFYNMREDKRYLKYLKPTIHKVAAVLADYKEYSVFRQIIIDNGLLEIDYMNPPEIIV